MYSLIIVSDFLTKPSSRIDVEQVADELRMLAPWESQKLMTLQEHYRFFDLESVPGSFRETSLVGLQLMMHNRQRQFNTIQIRYGFDVTDQNMEMRASNLLKVVGSIPVRVPIGFFAGQLTIEVLPSQSANGYRSGKKQIMSKSGLIDFYNQFYAPLAGSQF